MGTSPSGELFGFTARNSPSCTSGSFGNVVGITKDPLKVMHSIYSAKDYCGREESDKDNSVDVSYLARVKQYALQGLACRITYNHACCATITYI